jgi:hypothetical protein
MIADHTNHTKYNNDVFGFWCSWIPGLQFFDAMYQDIKIKILSFFIKYNLFI